MSGITNPHFGNACHMWGERYFEYCKFHLKHCEPRFEYFKPSLEYGEPSLAISNISLGISNPSSGPRKWGCPENGPDLLKTRGFEISAKTKKINQNLADTGKHRNSG